jgi:hypothetical protein
VRPEHVPLADLAGEHGDMRPEPGLGPACAHAGSPFARLAKSRKQALLMVDKESSPGLGNCIAGVIGVQAEHVDCHPDIPSQLNPAITRSGSGLGLVGVGGDHGRRYEDHGSSVPARFADADASRSLASVEP